MVDNFVWKNTTCRGTPIVFAWTSPSIQNQMHYKTAAFEGHSAWGLGGLVNARLLNALRPRQNGRHFADDILKCIFLNENVWIPIEISLKFVPKGPIDNIQALV